MNIFAFDDHRDVVRAFFTERAKRNPRYSLRAFSRDVGISASRLSEVLNGRSGSLSAHTVGSLSQRLGLGAREAAYFLALAQRDQSRSPGVREAAVAHIKRERLDA